MNDLTPFIFSSAHNFMSKRPDQSDSNKNTSDRSRCGSHMKSSLTAGVFFHICTTRHVILVLRALRYGWQDAGQLNDATERFLERRSAAF